MMNYFLCALMTLVLYSTISTLIFFIKKEDENVLLLAGLGIVGSIVTLIFETIGEINRLLKYHIGKRSIYENVHTNEKYKCKVSCNDDMDWNNDYKLIRRYAVKKEWDGIPDIPEDVIEKSKINCSNCKYYDWCGQFGHEVKCKTDFYGKVEEFDKFEKK